MWVLVLQDSVQLRNGAVGSKVSVQKQLFSSRCPHFFTDCDIPVFVPEFVWDPLVIMPVFSLFTNLSKDKIPDGLLEELTEVLEKILNKPKKYLCVHILPDQLIAFAGTRDPCGFATLVSIGAIGGEKNQGHSKILFDLIQLRLGIPGHRFYIDYHDQPASEIGHEGRTFAGLL